MAAPEGREGGDRDLSKHLESPEHFAFFYAGPQGSRPSSEPRGKTAFCTTEGRRSQSRSPVDVVLILGQVSGPLLAHI